MYDEQLPALSLPFLQEGISDGNQLSHDSFVDPGADGLPPPRAEFPALRPEVPERTKQPATAP